MKLLLPAFLQTRVAKRLFILFVMSALLPLAAIAFVSLAQVRELLLQQGDQRLLVIAKGLGMDFFARLGFAVEVAEVAGRAGARRGDDKTVARVFVSLARRHADGRTTPIAGEDVAVQPPPSARERAAQGEPTLYVAPVGAGHGVFIVAPDPAGFAFGQVRASFLWGPADEVPHETEFCVLDEASRAILHCHAPGGQGPLRAAASEPFDVGRTGRWKRDGEPHRGRGWAQFMAGKFGAPDWIVAASQPESLTLARLAEFQQIYIPAVALALALVTWFTIRQSRRIVEPLGRLAHRARELAAGTFAGRLAMPRDDEFGEVGHAFDRMSERLGRQFASLKALAEIDELILSTQDTTQVVRSVAGRIGEVAPADAITITLFDPEADGFASTYRIDRTESGGFLVERHAIAANERASLARDPAGRWVDLRAVEESEGTAHLASPRVAGLERAYVQPIIWRETAYGAIVLGFAAGNHADEEDTQRVRELADRVAVALSSSLRDEQLYRQAHFDSLTGRPNRLLFMDRLGVEIARSQREPRSFALLSIDLDGFKTVNESFGHSVGDMVLTEAAERIASCLRPSDTVARLGADEFAVLMTNIEAAQEAWLLSRAIIGALSREYQVAGHRCFLGASVGIAAYPDDGDSAETLMKSADIAMNRAKAEGRAQALFFEERMNTEVVARLTLDRDLRRAIDRGELQVHYQPKLDVRSGRIVGAEALVRWIHPERGAIPPSRFVPLAEASGFIETLGEWIFQQASAQVRRWRDDGLGIDHVAVNFSPRQFRRRDLVQAIASWVAAAGVPASAIQIEITEGLLVERGQAIERMLGELASVGHQIALDDFGTGFSSLSYLTRLPVDTIKIDRVFVEGLGASADSRAIVAAIVAMSHALGRSVVAEGVETDAQAAVLRELGCDQIQGYLVSPALPAEEFRRLVAGFSPTPAGQGALHL